MWGGGGGALDYNEAADQIEFCDLEAVGSPQWQVPMVWPCISLVLHQFSPAPVLALQEVIFTRWGICNSRSHIHLMGLSGAAANWRVVDTARDRQIFRLRERLRRIREWLDLLICRVRNLAASIVRVFPGFVSTCRCDQQFPRCRLGERQGRSC